MSSEERGQWVYVVVIVVTYGAYLVITLGQLGQTAPADIDYVPTMLWSIGIGIALAIVGRIVVEIVGGISAEIAGHDAGHDADVRDRDVGRFGEYVAGTVLGVGMIVPFVLTLAERRLLLDRERDVPRVRRVGGRRGGRQARRLSTRLLGRWASPRGSAIRSGACGSRPAR